MNFEQIQKIVEMAETSAEYHILYFGKDAYRTIYTEVKLAALSQQIKAPPNLLIPAFEYQGILFSNSPALPDNAMMVCTVDKEDIQILKENIGWPNDSTAE